MAGKLGDSNAATSLLPGDEQEDGNPAKRARLSDDS